MEEGDGGLADELIDCTLRNYTMSSVVAHSWFCLPLKTNIFTTNTINSFVLLFFLFRLRFKLTQIAVDTSAGPFKNYTVVFLGSDNGHVLKILASSEGANASFNTHLLEDIDVYNPNKSENTSLLSLMLSNVFSVISFISTVFVHRFSFFSFLCFSSFLSCFDPSVPHTLLSLLLHFASSCTAGGFIPASSFVTA